MENFEGTALWNLFSTLVTVMVLGKLALNTGLDLYCWVKRRRYAKRVKPRNRLG